MSKKNIFSSEKSKMRAIFVATFVIAFVFFTLAAKFDMWLNPWMDANNGNFSWWTIMTNSMGISMLYCKSKVAFYIIISIFSIIFATVATWFID